ncbi:MAG: DUF2088 domain-containing protein [Firmicutes bacterium]|nr:DUF2088 domain-containing protein [Bacillota bacterium]
MEFPRMFKIKQNFAQNQIADVPAKLKAELNKPEIRNKVKPGQKIAVAVGSRGISHINVIVKNVVDTLKIFGAEPFIVPAMGSHGGATAEGQAAVLAEYGITEEKIGVPIRSSMEVVKLGEVGGVPVYFDKIAYEEADAIVPINRVKAHTDIKAEIESGLMKIMVIGLGKHKGATSIHARGIDGLTRLVPEAGRFILEKTPIIFGVATVENSYDLPAAIEAIEASAIEEREKELLAKSKEWLPTFPVPNIDLLVVDEIGKNISGSGMDTNIIGRFTSREVPDPEEPMIKKIAVLGLSCETHGNATGIGLADIVTQKVVDEMDRVATFTNVITSTFFEGGMIPLTAANAKEAISLGIKFTHGWDTKAARVVRIKNTLKLYEMEVSESIWNEICNKERIEKIEGPYDWQFTEDGELKR